MTIESENVLKRMDRIESDLIELRSSLSRPRGKEYKQHVVRYVHNAFMEFNRTNIIQKIDCMNDFDHCSKRMICMKHIREEIEAASLAYIRGDFEKSQFNMEELRKKWEEMGEICESGNCNKHFGIIIAEIRAALILAMKIEMSDMETTRKIEEQSGPSLDAANTSLKLAAIAHPARLEIISTLEKKELAFSELSRQLNLRTGHLQYHLKVLVEEGYVRKERRGEYSITLQGLTALDGLREFMSGLKDVAPA